MNLYGYHNIVQASQQKLGTYHFEAQSHRLLGAVQPPSEFRLRLAAWFHHFGRWLEAYPPIIEYQPVLPLKSRPDQAEAQ